MILFMHVEILYIYAICPLLSYTLKLALETIEEKISLIIIDEPSACIHIFPTVLISTHQFSHYTIRNPKKMKMFCSLDVSICIGKTKIIMTGI